MTYVLIFEATELHLCYITQLIYYEIILTSKRQIDISKISLQEFK